MSFSSCYSEYMDQLLLLNFVCASRFSLIGMSHRLFLATFNQMYSLTIIVSCFFFECLVSEVGNVNSYVLVYGCARV